MSISASPAYARRHLRSRLRQLREEKPLTQKQAGDALGWSPAKIMRIEKGHVRVDRWDLEALLNLYAVAEGDSERDRLVRYQDIGKNGRSLIADYRAVLPKEVADYIEEEEAAKIIRSYELCFIPGPLQTEAYARAMLRFFGEFEDDADSPEQREKNEEILRRRVAARMVRKQFWQAGRGVQAFFIVHYSALMLQVGGDPSLMVEQLQWLKEINQDANVTIQVVPESAGLFSRNMRSPFAILEFDDDDSLVHQELPNSDVNIREDAKIVGELRLDFHHMESLASAKPDLDRVVDGALAQLRNA